MIDETDGIILDLLQENARISQADIARVVGLAPSAVLERIRKLEARGVIRGYTALLDPHTLDQSMLAFVAVRSEQAPGDDSVGLMEKFVAKELPAKTRALSRFPLRVGRYQKVSV